MSFTWAKAGFLTTACSYQGPGTPTFSNLVIRDNTHKKFKIHRYKKGVMRKTLISLRLPSLEVRLDSLLD